jgi:hypothetical protein
MRQGGFSTHSLSTTFYPARSTTLRFERRRLLRPSPQPCSKRGLSIQRDHSTTKRETEDILPKATPPPHCILHFSTSASSLLCSYVYNSICAQAAAPPTDPLDWQDQLARPSIRLSATTPLSQLITTQPSITDCDRRRVDFSFLSFLSFNSLLSRPTRRDYQRRR